MTEVRKMLLKWVATWCWGAARTQKAAALTGYCSDSPFLYLWGGRGGILTWLLVFVGRQNTFYPFSVPGNGFGPTRTFRASVLFLDRLLTKVRVVPLVKEELGSDPLDNDVPGIHRAGAAHQRGQNGVGGKHIALSLRQLQGGQQRDGATLGLTCPFTGGEGLVCKEPSHPYLHLCLSEPGCSKPASKLVSWVQGTAVSWPPVRPRHLRSGQQSAFIFT